MIIDVIDDLAAFATRWPMWLDSRGKPLSWRHFRYGMRQIPRESARWKLHAYGAVSAAQSNRLDHRTQWANLQRAIGGRNHG